jgi:cyclohexanone monooxygenase
MSTTTATRPAATPVHRTSVDVDCDVIVIGAGFAGLCALHHLRQRGNTVRCIEAGTEVGGTWYWNRYPGARVDIESHEYSYSFSEELQQEWVWSERYAAQPELLRYLIHVADRFDLRRDIQFETRVTAAHYEDATGTWTITTDRGRKMRATYLVMATGILSIPNQPKFPGLERFKGRHFHTSYWPREQVDFSGRRVGVIGTGSSAVQSIPIIAEQAGHLTVFQRTPSFCVPARNRANAPDHDRSIKARYAELREIEHEISFGGFFLTHSDLILPTLTRFADATPEERLAEFETRYESGGLNLYSTYTDILTNREANDALGEFLRAKIRERVKDPVVAEKLTPRGWPVLTKRLCADTNYYETYNRDNVTLIDIKDTPIETFNETGLRVGGKDYELDDVVFATGFDAMTGALARIDVRGRDGRLLKDHWSNGPRTYLGFMIHGFPNLFMLDGPGSPAAVFQPVLLSQFHSNWLGDCFDWLKHEGRGPIEATEASETEWVNHTNEVADATLFPEANSWYMGANIPGKPRVILTYLGGFLEYRRRLAVATEAGYSGFKLGL